MQGREGAGRYPIRQYHAETCQHRQEKWIGARFHSDCFLTETAARLFVLFLPGVLTPYLRKRNPHSPTAPNAIRAKVLGSGQAVSGTAGIPVRSGGFASAPTGFENTELRPTKHQAVAKLVDVPVHA